MSKLRVQSFAMSIDGYGAGSNQDLQNPLGVSGPELMECFFPTRVWRKMHGHDDGETGVDNEVAEIWPLCCDGRLVRRRQSVVFARYSYSLTNNRLETGNVRRILPINYSGFGADSDRERLGQRRVVHLLRIARPRRRTLPAFSRAADASRCPRSLSDGDHATADPGHDRRCAPARRHLRADASTQGPRASPE